MDKPPTDVEVDPTQRSRVEKHGSVLLEQIDDGTSLVEVCHRLSIRLGPQDVSDPSLLLVSPQSAALLEVTKPTASGAKNYTVRWRVGRFYARNFGPQRPIPDPPAQVGPAIDKLLSWWTDSLKLTKFLSLHPILFLCGSVCEFAPPTLPTSPISCRCRSWACAN